MHKLSKEQYIHIPPSRRQSIEIREALNRRIMSGIPVIEEDGWKYARTDREMREFLATKKK